MTDQVPGRIGLHTSHSQMIFLAALLSLTLGSMGQQPAASPREADHADRIVVHKKERTLELFRNGSAFRKYNVALGTQPVGPKTQQGDHKTPEGTYVVDRRNDHSHYYRALHISYPNAEDRERAQKLGVPAGGDIMIHGLPNGFGWMGASHRLKDWTDGCIAVTDREMDEIWKLVPDGTSVEIDP